MISSSPWTTDLGAHANACRATLYPLDAGGLRADSAASVTWADSQFRPSGLVTQIERANLQASLSLLAQATGGKAIQALALLAVMAGIVYIGVYGYFVPAAVRVGLSKYQPLMVGVFMILFMALEVPIFRGAKSLGEIRWGKMPRLSQYVLFFLAVTFTWLMGLMGYIRSGIRQHWHVYQVMKDTSENAFIPTHGFATMVVSIIVIIFFLLVSMVFALAMRSELKERETN